MAEPQLSVRSARAIEIAHRLARQDGRTVANIVERALIEYDARNSMREPAELFYRRLAQNGVDFDLLELTKDMHEPHRGIDL